ncbi:MAG TPA: site-specific integrase [Streptosporangiaceae bacterium]|nr:site-specific integrase [Streptosporangiaceae bacterium]
MTAADRWHKSRPQPGEPTCGEHRGKVPTAAHGKGLRWEVRWRDENGKQHKQGFAKEADAESRAAVIKTQLDAGTYTDPAAGKVKLRVRGELYVQGLTVDESTREAIESRLRLHVYPDLGDREMRILGRSPSILQAWMRSLHAKLAPSYIRVIRIHLSSIFDAAVDDGIIVRNPLRAASVRAPRLPRRKVEPWPEEQVTAVIAALPPRFRAMGELAAGCGERQGELFATGVDDVDWLATRKMLRVRRQVKIVRGHLVFAPPKGDRFREIPMAEPVALALSAHLARFPAVRVTLPWKVPGGKPVTVPLIFTSAAGKAVVRHDFNKGAWKPALEAAGVIEPRPEGATTWGPDRENGMHALRHFYASALLADGVDIRAVAEYLGHSDPGFTLRVYVHLMPSAEARAAAAIERIYERRAAAADGSCALDVPGGQG